MTESQMRSAKLAWLMLIFVLLAGHVAAQAPTQSTIRGVVHDSSGKSLAGVLVELRHADGPIQTTPLQTAKTNAAGDFQFSPLDGGQYSLHATLDEYSAATSGPMALPSSSTKVVNLVLVPKTVSSQPEFFDEPQFTVAGVTDTTTLGGHGSDVIVRNRDALAHDTASLGKTTAASDSSLPSTEQSLRAALLRTPNDARLHHQLAEVEEKSGNSLEAVREYQRAAELDPSEGNIFDWGAELLLHHADEPAVEVFGRGSRAFPRSVRMKSALGIVWYARGDHEKAVQELAAASDLDPNDSNPYIFLGKIQATEKLSVRPALEKLARFARLQSENALANYYYALALWKQRKPDDSRTIAQVESLLQKAVKLDPKLGLAHLQLGILYAEQKDRPKAIASFEAAATANPDMEEAHYRLGQAYRQAGDEAKAKREFALYDEVVKKQTQQQEKQRHEIQQFVYTLRDGPPASPQQ